jgi:(p)ppGpp synthase/HD superfamily hydrolase
MSFQENMGSYVRKLEHNRLAIRHEELEARANLAASAGKPNVKSNLDKLRSSEAHAAMYRKIKKLSAGNTI